MPHAPVPLSAPRRAHGFTLLELMVVLVLAGILISVVTVSVTPDNRQALGREAARVGQLLSIAADEARIRQVPIVWEADLQGYRFVTEVAGERELIANDDMLRGRTWERPLTQLSMTEVGADQPSQVLLGPGAAPVRVAVVREYIQPRWRLELANDVARVAVDFDETGRGNVTLLP
jgi:general secretion pathway protein H